MPNGCGTVPGPELDVVLNDDAEGERRVSRGHRASLNRDEQSSERDLASQVYIPNQCMRCSIM